MEFDWDFAGGEAEFKKALKLDPNHATVHHFYAFDIGMIGGREQEALAEINRAHLLDPSSLLISVRMGDVHRWARRYDESIVVCKKLADEKPDICRSAPLFSDCVLGKAHVPGGH